LFIGRKITEQNVTALKAAQADHSKLCMRKMAVYCYTEDFYYNFSSQLLLVVTRRCYEKIELYISCELVVN
jgi:hypothetical protein